MDKEIKEKSLTPLPSRKQGESVTMSFFDALKAIVDGKKVTRIEWANKDYCLLKDESLGIFKDGKFFTYWNISLGDIEGQDWVVVNDTN